MSGRTRLMDFFDHKEVLVEGPGVKIRGRLYLDSWSDNCLLLTNDRGLVLMRHWQVIKEVE